MTKVIGKFKLPTATAAKKAVSKNNAPLYVIGVCNYSNWDKFIKIISKGKVALKVTENGMYLEHDENLPSMPALAVHRKYMQVKGYMEKNPNAKSHDGLLLCEEKNIEAVTKNINTFFSSKNVKDKQIPTMVTFFNMCEEYTGDIDKKATRPAIENKLIPKTEPAKA